MRIDFIILWWIIINNQINCELVERTSIREARELLFNVWVVEQGLSRKLSIFDTWCIETKNVCFHLNIDTSQKNSTLPGPNLTLIECLYLGKYGTYEKKKIIRQKS